MDATNGIVPEYEARIQHLEAENERLQKKLQEARAACDLYENELIKLRDKYDSAKHALWISQGYEKMMLDGSDETAAPVQSLGNLKPFEMNTTFTEHATPESIKQALNVWDDDDTQEVDVEPVQSCQYCGQVLLSPLFEFGVNGLFCSSDCVQRERDFQEIARRDFEREIYKQADNEDES